MRVNKRVQTVYTWYNQPVEIRWSRQQLLKELGMSVNQLEEIIAQIEAKKGLNIADQIKIIDNISFQKAREGGKTDRELWYQRHGLLVQKAEVKNINVYLTADELSRIEDEARRRNEAEGFSFGKGEMQGQRKILPNYLRLDSGQGDSKED